MQHDLTRRASVLHSVVMPEGDAQIARNVRQPPSPPPVLSGPCETGNPGAIQPGRLNLFKSIFIHRPLKRDAVKCRVTYENRPVQAAAQLNVNLGESRAVRNGSFVNPVDPDIDGIESLSRVDQYGPLVLNRAAAEANDAYLTDAGRIGVCRFNVDGGKRQVAGGASSLCRAGGVVCPHLLVARFLRFVIGAKMIDTGYKSRV